MIVTYCVHRTIHNGNDVKQWLTSVTRELINQGAKTFYLGDYGAFDTMCKKVLAMHKKTYEDIELLLIVPYINHTMCTHGYDGTLYPGIEETPPRHAILKRNQWMVEHSDFVVAYVTSHIGGAAKTLQHARRKRKPTLCYQKSTREK